MMRKCYSVSRSPIDENNDNVSKSWIVFRHRIFTKLTFSAKYSTAEDLAISKTCYELTQTSPLAISPQLFHSILKTLLLSKCYPDSSSFPYLRPRLNSKHHPPYPSDCLPV